MRNSDISLIHVWEETLENAKGLESKRPVGLTGSLRYTKNIELDTNLGPHKQLPQDRKETEKIWKEKDFLILSAFYFWFYKTELTQKTLKYQIRFQIICVFCNRID